MCACSRGCTSVCCCSCCVLCAHACMEAKDQLGCHSSSTMYNCPPLSVSVYVPPPCVYAPSVCVCPLPLCVCMPMHVCVCMRACMCILSRIFYRPTACQLVGLGWLASEYQAPSVSSTISPLGLQPYPKLRYYVGLVDELRSSCLWGNHFTNWSISHPSCVDFSLTEARLASRSLSPSQYTLFYYLRSLYNHIYM